MRSSVPVSASARLGGTVAKSCAAVLVLLAAAGCSTLHSASNAVLGNDRPPEGTPGYVRGFLGGAVADEPRAALAARNVLSGGGDAADAAVAAGFALAVTLPSRASLGAGGVCLAYTPDPKSAAGGVPEAIMFLSPAVPPSGDRPAAVPMLARGLFALHARYGRQQFETLVVPAEEMARFGVPASRALVRDISVVAAPLLSDSAAAAVFGPKGQALAEGDTLQQPDLAATLAQIRTAGVGDLYQGVLSHGVAEAARRAGGGLTEDELRDALPRLAAPLRIPAPGGDAIAFSPLPADGGLAAAAAFQALRADPNDPAAAEARGLAMATAFRQHGGEAQALLASALPAPALPALPASTGFATLDKDGNAVVCEVSLNNLFGTGRIAPGTGVVLGASPSVTPMPLFAAAIGWNPNVHAFHAEVAGTGQEGAPLAAASTLAQVYAGRTAPLAPAPDPGRANVIACPRYLPGESSTCFWQADPRGTGLAVGSN